MCLRKHNPLKLPIDWPLLREKEYNITALWLAIIEIETEGRGGERGGIHVVCVYFARKRNKEVCKCH